MTYIERGLYRDLLDEQWEKGSVSGDIEDMADICGCPVDVMASAWQVLNRCFTLVNGRYINETLEQQRTEKDNLRIRLAENGRLGGVAKAQRNQEEFGKGQASAKQPLANSGSLSRLEEERIEKKEEKRNTNIKFTAPSVADVRAYCEERKNKVDPERFHAYYESNGWRVGKNPMKNWKAAVRTWEGNQPKDNKDGCRSAGKPGKYENIGVTV